MSKQNMEEEMGKIAESLDRMGLDGADNSTRSEQEQVAVTLGQEQTVVSEKEPSKHEHEDETKSEESDDVESPDHPAFVPRAPSYFMHDLRDAQKSEVEVKILTHRGSRADRQWEHDLYDETMQGPKDLNKSMWKCRFDRNDQVGLSLISRCAFSLRSPEATHVLMGVG
ncbi:unnamed protein product [Toxocara canis]|uniref:Protein CASC3 n=1 Tax=Toxocara canis TaxID=6265 RepID=A0A183U695_TOXCA|nr:unnamed protein product [Toxocara canis]